MWFDGHNYQDFGTQVFGAKAASLGFVPRVRDYNFGFYGLFDQVVFKFSSPDERIPRGIGVTGCVQAAPLQERSTLPLFFETGILARGIFRARPRDVAGFGIFYGHFSDDLRHPAGRPAPRPEAGGAARGDSPGVELHLPVQELGVLLRAQLAIHHTARRHRGLTPSKSAPRPTSTFEDATDHA